MSRSRRVAGYCPSPKRKPGYRTERRARQARDRALAQQLRGLTIRRPLWIYRCPIRGCGWWHLTHEPPRHHQHGDDDIGDSTSRAA